jgi:hypothetical protein
MKHIALVVEGHGDLAAVPDMLRRYLALQGFTGVRVGKPLNAKNRAKLLKAGELERFAELAMRQPGAGALVVVFDADKDPACEIGPTALDRLTACLNVPVKVCIAVREFENWIMASAETIFEGLEPPDDPEGAGAAYAIKQALKPQAYVKPRDQPALAKRIDFDLARSRAPSLDHFLRIVDDLAAALADPGPQAT